MNRYQRTALIVGLLVILAMALFPPWRAPTEWGESVAGYFFLFRPTPGEAILRIDTVRLAVQCLAVLALTSVIYLILRRDQE